MASQRFHKHDQCHRLTAKLTLFQPNYPVSENGPSLGIVRRRTTKRYYQLHPYKGIYLGEDKLASLYSQALSLQNIEAQVFNVEEATLLGLRAAHKKVFP